MTDLIPSISIEAFVMRRDAVVARLQGAALQITEAQELVQSCLDRVPYAMSIQDPCSHRDFAANNAASTCAAVDAAMWAYLLDKSGMRSFLDAEAREKWTKAINDKDVPPLTKSNIEATFGALHEERGNMLERGVCELFRKLSFDFKTNTPRMLGKKVILTYFLDIWRGGHISLSTSGCNRLDDIIRICSLLDGKPEPDHRNGAYARLGAAKWPSWKNPAPFNFDYFTVRAFKKGTAHLVFLRSDVVDQMNRIIAKHHPTALPPSDE